MEEKQIIINDIPTEYYIRSNGEIYSAKRNRVLKGSTSAGDYRRVYLTVDGKQVNILPHRLVAEYFIPNPDNLPIVHHKDGNSFNNDISNLQWATASENMQAAVIAGKKPAAPPEFVTNWVGWKDASANGERLYGYAAHPSGKIANINTNRILKGSDRCGYKRVNIDEKVYSIHRIIYETFVGPIDEDQVIDHINGDKGDNRLENLRIVSQSENMQASHNNGHAGNVAINQIDADGNIVAIYETIQQAADAMGVTHPAIRSALTRGGKSAGYYWKRA